MRRGGARHRARLLGRCVPLEELRVACGVSRDGSKASNIVQGGARVRPRGQGLRREADELLPAAVPGDRLLELQPFRGGRGRPQDKVYLNDPATGPRTSRARSSTRPSPASSLTFEPGPDFAPGGDAAGLLPRWRGRLQGLRRGARLRRLDRPDAGAPRAGRPGLHAGLRRQHPGRAVDGWLSPLLVGLAPRRCMQRAADVGCRSCAAAPRAQAGARAVGRFFWHVLRLPIEFFSQRYAGESSAASRSTTASPRCWRATSATRPRAACTSAFLGVVMMLLRRDPGGDRARRRRAQRRRAPPRCGAALADAACACDRSRASCRAPPSAACRRSRP